MTSHVSKRSSAALLVRAFSAAVLSFVLAMTARADTVSLIVEASLDAQKMACTARDDYRASRDPGGVELREFQRGDALREFCRGNTHLLVTLQRAGDQRPSCPNQDLSGVPLARTNDGATVWMYWNPRAQNESLGPFLQFTVPRAKYYAELGRLSDVQVQEIRASLRPSNDDIAAQFIARVLPRYGMRPEIAAQPPRGALKTDDAKILRGDSTTLRWEAGGASVVSVTPDGPPPTCLSAIGSQPISPQTTKKYTLALWGVGGPFERTASVEVSDPPLPHGTFVAEPSTVDAGSTFVLSWTSENAATVTIEGLGPVTPVERGTTAPITATTTSTYRLTLDGRGGSTFLDATVKVPPAGRLWAEPDTIIAGQPFDLRWESTNASAAAIDNEVGPVSPLETGVRTLSPLADTTYTLTLEGPGGTVSAQTSVTVIQRPDGTLSAAPFDSDGSLVLSWNSSNANTASIDNGVGPLVEVAAGSIRVRPVSDTTYVLTLVGTGGTVTRAVAVSIPDANAPTGTFAADPHDDGSSTLSWTSANADSASIDNGVGELTDVAAGSIVVTPEYPATYTLTLVGRGGSRTLEIGVPGRPSPPFPIWPIVVAAVVLGFAGWFFWPRKPPATDTPGEKDPAPPVPKLRTKISDDTTPPRQKIDGAELGLEVAYEIVADGPPAISISFKEGTNP